MQLRRINQGLGGAVMGARWTPQECRRVVLWWGWVDIATIARRLHRTPRAVQHLGQRLQLGHVRETETLQQFTARTGYTDKQVLKAVAALGIVLRRKARVSVRRNDGRRRRVNVGARGQGAARAITEEQGAAIVEWLREQTRHCWRLQSGGKVREGVWGVGRKPKCCRKCGTTERPHAAKGMCGQCYDRTRQSTPEAKERARLRQQARRAWRKAGNPGLPPRAGMPIAASRVPPAAPPLTPRPHPRSRIGRPRLAPLASP